MKPTKEQLYDLYWTQRLSQREIGAVYGVAHISVGRWLKSYNIPRRDQGRGLKHRGVTPPTTNELYRMVHIEHLSYRLIGERYGVDQSAVQHWLRNHNVPTPKIWDTRKSTTGWGPPTAENLQHLYVEEGFTTAEIGELFGVASSTVGNWLKSHGITARDAGWNKGRYTARDGHRTKSAYERQVDNWLFAHNIAHVYEPQLPFDLRSKADFLANGWYIEIWGVTNNKTYEARKKRKRGLYVETNTPLIDIPRSAFASNRHALLERKLRKCFNPAPDGASPLQNSSLPLEKPDA